MEIPDWLYLAAVVLHALEIVHRVYYTPKDPLHWNRVEKSQAVHHKIEAPFIAHNHPETQQKNQPQQMQEQVHHESMEPLPLNKFFGFFQRFRRLTPFFHHRNNGGERQNNQLVEHENENWYPNNAGNRNCNGIRIDYH